MRDQRSDKLGDKLIGERRGTSVANLKLMASIEIRVIRCLRPPPSLDETSSNKIRALPTMTLRSLRLKISKLFKQVPGQATVLVWLQMGDGSFSPLGRELDKQSLDWLGFEQDSTLCACVEDGT
jgi:hypothetical protein